VKALNLGTGSRPLSGFLNHDISIHSSWVDFAWDLEKLPWPWDDAEWEQVRADDVFEHLRLEIVTWLDETWRILVPGGSLSMRLPAFDNPLSYRDPTHRRVFHPETFDYFDPSKQLWQEFGRYYYPDARPWAVRFDGREFNDLRFTLTKR
jgi:predicted SAM-dependent methyltransferase